VSNLNPRTVRTRADILDVAWKLFARKGTGVSMSEVADAAGLTRQAVYVHFRSRGGLLVALVRRADERHDIHEKFRGALRVEDPAGRLDAFLRVWFDFVPEIHPVATTLSRARADDPDAAAAWDDRMQSLHRGFQSLAASLRRDGALGRDWTAPAAADYLWAGSSVATWELLAVAREWGAAKTSKVLRRSLAAAVLAPSAQVTTR
jgi:AcrR family transcriptional regulator